MPTPLTAITLIAAFCITGCATYRGMPIYGPSHLVSPHDLRLVVLATQKGINRPDQLHAFRVVSRDEVWVYPYEPGHAFYGSYWIVKRVHGHWRCNDISMVVTPHA